jgi:hypothetical protein
MAVDPHAIVTEAIKALDDRSDVTVTETHMGWKIASTSDPEDAVYVELLG